MHHRSNVIMRAAVAAVLAAVSFSAAAFFPFGVWNQNRRLVYVTWPRSLMDVNSDGDITDGEGIPYYVEEGNLGFNEDEIQIVREAFDVWQNIPTSYVAFREVGRITQPRPGAALDNLNTISLAFPGEEEAGLVGGGILGVTAFTFSVADGFVNGANVTGGQFLEADIVIDADAVRGVAPGVAPGFDLMSIMVHEIGHFIGLDHTPMNNLQDYGTETAPFLVDPAVLALRDATGQLVRTGATPTMFPIYFRTEYDWGIGPGASVLAPDDIAAATFLYPRQDTQNNWFSIVREVRNQASHVFPSRPIPGAHIVAWADADDNPGTPRVPLISTMSALYADPTDVSVRGRFILRGLPKQMETFAMNDPFFVTYTFTSSPIDGSGYLNQAPPGYGPGDFDSTQLGGLARAYPLETVFYGETFHEQGNVFGIDKFSVGTPIVFDGIRQKPVSTISGLTLDSILAGFRPMFGDRPNVCFLNLAAGSLKTTRGNDFLRGMRDDWLRRTAVGIAVVDAYYGVSPAVTRFLTTYPTGLRVLRGAMWCVEQTIAHVRVLGALIVLFLGGLLVHRRRWRRGVALSALALASMLTLPFAAHASTYLWFTEDLLNHATDVVSGRVSTVNVLPNDAGRPETLINVVVTGKALGDVNKSGDVYIKQLGGRIGNLVTHVAAYPRFREGEEVVLFLFYRPDFGHYSVVGGQRGKLDVLRDAKTGEAYVMGIEEPAASALGAVKSADGRTGVPVERYLRYVREVAAQMQAESEQEEGQEQ